MEAKEQKKPGQPEGKLSYDELNKAASEIHLQYQRLTEQYRKLAQEHQRALEALQSREFDYTSFLVSMLFKVVEHPDQFDYDFVKWCVTNIQDALRSFHAAMNEKPGEERTDAAQ